MKNEEDGACSTYGERRRAYRVLVTKSLGKRSFGRPRHRWDVNNCKRGNLRINEKLRHVRATIVAV